MKKGIVVKADMEARLSANLVQVANQYTSRIYFEVGGKRVNAKSIMGMMSLTLIKGEEITLDVEGTDEEEAIDELSRFLTEPATVE